MVKLQVMFAAVQYRGVVAVVGSLLVSVAVVEDGLLMLYLVMMLVLLGEKEFILCGG